MHLRQRHLLHNLHWLQKVIHWWNGKATRRRFREHLRYVERNDKDASKPVARHLNLPNHSKKHMAGCGLFLHLSSAESLKTQEQKVIFQIGTLSPHGINERFSFNQVTLVFSTTTPKFLPLSKGQRSKRQFFNSLRWPVYVINSVTNTKLPRYTRRWCRPCLKQHPCLLN